MNGEDNSLWVFGYGSLCWHPGFEYGDSVLGHIEGFSRRFYQGNTTHRGVEGKPGRVATLTEEKTARTHGVAFQLLGENALDYLERRECSLGGYVTHITLFHPRDGTKQAFPVLLYMATDANRHWLGPAPFSEIAEQVVTSSGASGHNVEYVLRLAEWVRLALPDVHDEHLFTLEMHVRAKIKEKNLCTKAMMRECQGDCDHIDVAGQEPEEAVPEPQGGEADRTDTFAFVSQVDRKDMRCLKV